MGRITEMLDAIDVREENTEELYNIFRIVPDYDIPMIRFCLITENSLIRHRINEKGKEFYSVSELSCPPADCFKYYERSNVPHQSMCYACAFQGNPESEDFMPPRVVALM